MSTISDTIEWKLRSAEEFAAYFQSDLSPCLAACEQDRQRAARNVTTIAIVALVLVMIAALVILSSGAPPMALIIVVIAGFAVAGIGSAYATSGFKQRYKHNLISQIVRFFGPDFRYQPENCVSESRFLQSRIFEHRIDRFGGEDYISGTAGKTRFECSELHAQYKTTTTDSKGRRRTQWHTIFKGLYFVADFNKHFAGTTLVLPDVAESSFGWLGQKLQGMNFSRPGELVRLEDPEFEKLFVVYGTDQVEARYILSPALMRRLIDIRRKIGRAIHLSFKDGCVFVAMDPGKNLLEPKLFSPVSYESCRSAFADLRLVLEIVEDLNLNTRIWSKQ